MEPRLLPGFCSSLFGPPPIRFEFEFQFGFGGATTLKLKPTLCHYSTSLRQNKRGGGGCRIPNKSLSPSPTIDFGRCAILGQFTHFNAHKSKESILQNQPMPFKECFVYAVAYIQLAKSPRVAKSEKGSKNPFLLSPIQSLSSSSDGGNKNSGRRRRRRRRRPK